MVLPNYEVYAVRYASVARTRSENFLLSDCGHGQMPIDYFVWLIVSEERRFLVDTGFDETAALERKRTFFGCPIDRLGGLGVTAADISDVILTHMHYDHSGNIEKLPSARFHLQQAEMAYATGTYMGFSMLSHPYSVNDVTDLVRRVYEQRVVFHDGDVLLTPGISLHKVGGHTGGLQVVRVHTQRGWIVLASDACHFFENIRERSPFPIVFNVGEMLEGYERVEALADSADHIIPGHDPKVRDMYPLARNNLQDIVRLDLPFC